MQACSTLRQINRTGEEKDADSVKQTALKAEKQRQFNVYLASPKEKSSLLILVEKDNKIVGYGSLFSGNIGLQFIPEARGLGLGKATLKLLFCLSDEVDAGMRFGGRWGMGTSEFSLFPRPFPSPLSLSISISPHFTFPFIPLRFVILQGGSSGERS